MGNENLEKLKLMGCSGIKISFEDEGALLNEVITMRYVTSNKNLKLSIKIGGCEAKRDIVDSIYLNCDSIVAPMIESEFSLKKFTNSLNKYNYKKQKGFNLETIHGFQNIDTIFPLINNVDFITFGRVDFINSLNKNRDFVETEEIYEIVKTTFEKAKQFNPNIKCFLGGAISIKSKDFIKKLFDLNLLDSFETRYIIFDAKLIDFNLFEELIYRANIFELEWLKFINQRYEFIANKDIERIKMIEERISNNNINK